MSPIRVDKEEKKRALLSAARRVFAQKGFASTKIEDVAREAGIGKGTVYEYFRSKDDIFFALFEEFKAEFHKRIFVMAPKSPPQERLKKYITSALSAFEEWKDMSHILLDFWAEHKSKSSAHFRFDELYKVARENLSTFIQEGIKKGVYKKVDPAHTASILIAIIDGLLLQWVFNPKSFSLRDIGSDVAAIFLSGIKKEKSR